MKEKGLKKKEKKFWKKLAALLRGGVPPRQAIETLQDEMEGSALAVVLDQVLEGLDEGRSLTECLEEHPDTFHPALVEVLAGEGELGDEFPPPPPGRGRGRGPRGHGRGRHGHHGPPPHPAGPPPPPPPGPGGPHAGPPHHGAPPPPPPGPGAPHAGPPHHGAPPHAPPPPPPPGPEGRGPGRRGGPGFFRELERAGEELGAGLGSIVEALQEVAETFPRVSQRIRDRRSERSARRSARRARRGRGLSERGPLESQAPAWEARVEELFEELRGRRVSDLHLEATSGGGRIRIRVDGVLEHFRDLSVSQRERLVRAFKRSAALDPEETELPQDGMVHLRQEDDGESRELHLRVAVGPTVHGESVTVRVLERERVQDTLGRPELLLQDVVREEALELARQPYGLVIVSGPTGCGKTSTLLGFLHQLPRDRLKVVCIEDPAEVLLDGVHQIQIRPSHGLSYAAALRHTLRLDPDVIYCSEVRDMETANLLVKAAATGHLVFTSLHAPTAPDALMRLLEVGGEPHLIGEVLLGVVGQRLVRRLDPETAVPEADHLEVLAGLRSEPLPEGARALAPGEVPEGGTGYRGRLPIQELLRMTPELRRLFTRRPTRAELVAQARKDGYRTLRENGVERVLAGETSVTEVLRVCPPEPGTE